MVKFNPELGQILSKVFSSKNMQLELTKYDNDNTKCYSKQCTGSKKPQKKKKTEQNFNPGLAKSRPSRNRACLAKPGVKKVQNSN